jgi:hypothetical protein
VQSPEGERVFKVQRSTFNGKGRFEATIEDYTWNLELRTTVNLFPVE